MRQWKGVRRVDGSTAVEMHDGHDWRSIRPLHDGTEELPPFDWGKTSRGTLSLAWTILVTACGAEFWAITRLMSPAFAIDVVEHMPEGGWHLTDYEVLEFFSMMRAEQGSAEQAIRHRLPYGPKRPQEAGG